MNHQRIVGMCHQNGNELKYQVLWVALVFLFVAGVAGSLGCMTMVASETADKLRAHNYVPPVFQDEIVALGRPDAALSQQLGQNHVVAFIGLKNTYLLNKGGEELERISQLKLDGKRMNVRSDNGRLYIKDKQIWGDLLLTYGNHDTISAAERTELERVGFRAESKSGNYYWKEIKIEGATCPAIKLSNEQMSRLTVRRAFNLYDPHNAKPPILSTILREYVEAPMIVAGGVVADIALTPVYLGVGTIGIAAEAGRSIK